MFGEYVLSTQAGYELLQGHNPNSKGSWMGDWKNSSSPNLIYAHSQINNIEELNELEEGKARKKLH